MKTEYEDGSLRRSEWGFWVFGVGGCFALLAELPLVLGFPPLAQWYAPRGRQRGQRETYVTGFYILRKINKLQKKKKSSYIYFNVVNLDGQIFN